MEKIMLKIGVAVMAYLLGSLNFSIIVSKKALKDDIRKHGSGNAGLTNSYRTMGGRLSAIVLIGDFAKGIIAAAIGGALLGAEWKLIAGVFVLLGHMFPIYFGFRGGKGVLTGAAVELIFSPVAFAASLVLFIAAVSVTKYISLGSILATAVFPICVWFLHRDIKMLFLALLLAMMIIIKHHSNILRLIKGTESKFRFKRKEEGNK